MRYPPATADEGLISKTHTAQCTHNVSSEMIITHFGNESGKRSILLSPGINKTCTHSLNQQTKE